MTKVEKLRIVDEWLQGKGYNLNAFYAVTIYPDYINLQGTFSPGIASKMPECKMAVGDGGYIYGETNLPFLGESEPEQSLFLVKITLT